MSDSKPNRSLFRPCIDLHRGLVKQIVGGSLSDSDPEGLKTNFVARSDRSSSERGDDPDSSEASSQSPAEFALMYRQHGLAGGHVIKLGAGNDEAAKEALAAWPSTLLDDIDDLGV